MKSLPAGTIKRIHVNRQVVARNRKFNQEKPAITIQTSRGPIRARQAVVRGTMHVIQAGRHTKRKQLGCGAMIWLETTSKILYA